MRLTYFGHSCFLLQAVDGTRVILDPYRCGSFDGAIRYEPVDETADVVIASHLHDDHGATDTIAGSPRVLAHPVLETTGAVKITGVDVAHDECGGEKRGKNTIVVLDDGDVRVAHLGDLGHTLDEHMLKAIGPVDVVLVPVGGFFTIDHDEAAQVIESLDPKIVVPMHYKTDKVDFPIAAVDPFLATQELVKRSDDCVLEITKTTLPADRVTILLKHAR
ncbi:MAG: MBL fold metallo-hydrolase [Thermoleophilia bacterium]|nr:MBL fold metallo-hydrolase [Thermoleophilia bacterium]